MPRCVIVVPCYNEADRLPADDFLAYARRHADTHFLFVNDGSPDATGAVLEALSERNPRQFAVLTLPANRGKAEAVRAGCLEAFAGGPEFVGYWDADLATPLTLIPDFRQVFADLPAVELVCGARVKLLGRTIERKPLRHYLGRVFASVASWTLGLHLYDTQCGAKLFRATPRLQAAFAEPFRTRWLFDIEILCRLLLWDRGLGVTGLDGSTYELPLRAWRDVAGSKVRPRDFFKAFVELARIHRTYFRHAAPPAAAPAPLPIDLSEVPAAPRRAA